MFLFLFPGGYQDAGPYYTRTRVLSPETLQNVIYQRRSVFCHSSALDIISLRVHKDVSMLDFGHKELDGGSDREIRRLAEMIEIEAFIDGVFWSCAGLSKWIIFKSRKFERIPWLTPVTKHSE